MIVFYSTRRFVPGALCILLMESMSNLDCLLLHYVLPHANACRTRKNIQQTSGNLKEWKHGYYIHKIVHATSDEWAR